MESEMGNTDNNLIPVIHEGKQVGWAHTWPSGGGEVKGDFYASKEAAAEIANLTQKTFDVPVEIPYRRKENADREERERIEAAKKIGPAPLPTLQDWREWDDAIRYVTSKILKRWTVEEEVSQPIVVEKS